MATLDNRLQALERQTMGSDQCLALAFVYPDSTAKHRQQIEARQAAGERLCVVEFVRARPFPNGLHRPLRLQQASKNFKVSSVASLASA